MDISIAISVILTKSQPLLIILGLSSSVTAVQLATLFAITLAFIAITFGILAFVKSQMAIHYNREDLLRLTAITLAIIAGSALALLGFPFAIIAMTSGLCCLSILLIDTYFFETKAIQHYIVKLQEDELILTPDESISFEAGVQAGDSCQGFFTSWTVKESYTNYSAYTAGKILREGHSDKAELIIDKVYKKTNPN